MSVNPTFRRLTAAGPSSEVQWLVERARGRLGPPVRPGSAWRTRSELSVRALADLLPYDKRPPVIPEEIDRVWLYEVWESRDGMSQARWGLTDYVWGDDSLFVLLLAALSSRYKNLCFVTAWEDPDMFEAASALIWRGRVRRRPLYKAEYAWIKKTIYARYGLSPDDDDPDADESIADSDLDMAMLDYVQRHWDPQVQRILRGCLGRGDRTEGL